MFFNVVTKSWTFESILSLSGFVESYSIESVRSKSNASMFVYIVERIGFSNCAGLYLKRSFLVIALNTSVCSSLTSGLGRSKTSNFLISAKKIYNRKRNCITILLIIIYLTCVRYKLNSKSTMSKWLTVVIDAMFLWNQSN